MKREDADRYERESIMRAGVYPPRIEMLSAVVRNVPLAPTENQGKKKNEPETQTA